MAFKGLAMHLGLGQGHVPTDPADFTPGRARQIAALSVTRLITHFEIELDGLAGARGEELGAMLREHGLRIAQYGGLTPNLVVADPGVRRESLDAIAALMRSARSVGAEAVLFGCGSHHPSFSYGPAVENHTPATREWLLGSLRELALRAENAGVPATLEVHVLTALDTPEHVRELLDELDSPWVRANYDPVNFLGSLRDVFASGEVAEHAAATIGPRLAPSAHVKDVVVEPELVLKIAEAPPGTGIMDLEAVLRACRHLPPGSALIVEHLGPEESEAALRHVAALAERCGVALDP
jgi:L-ribulose-5-phosphate 3-epimerase